MAVEDNTRSGRLRPRVLNRLIGLQQLPRPSRPQRMPMDQCKGSNPLEPPPRAVRKPPSTPLISPAVVTDNPGAFACHDFISLPRNSHCLTTSRVSVLLSYSS